jgi:serine O-acetyltransferase
VEQRVTYARLWHCQGRAVSILGDGKGEQGMFGRLKRDIEVVFDRDPAARSVLEVLLCYPGLKAIWAHRLSHWLWVRDWKLVARVISQMARFFTQIEIHPGATIGEGFFIDHGAGIVIGETTEIGNNVTLYQGVTLGGTGHEKGKRHPTLGDNVVVGNGARILGSFTVGENSRIGAGAVVLREVPPEATVVGNPGRIVRQGGQRVDPLDHVHLPDPVMAMFDTISKEMQELRRRVDVLETENAGLRRSLQEGVFHGDSDIQ